MLNRVALSTAEIESMLGKVSKLFKLPAMAYHLLR